MGQSTQYGRWAVWLLAAVLLSPSVVKIAHNDNRCPVGTHDACPDDARPQHDCSACPVCHFALASFTEAASGSEHPLLAYVADTTVPPVRASACPPLFSSHGLRAPPTV